MKYQTKIKRIVCVILLAAMVCCLAGCQKEKTALNPKEPVTVTVWNYYNGDQQAAFEQMAQEFNSTVGAEKGIVVMCISQGRIDTLVDSLLAAVVGEAGSGEVPQLAAVYAETAYILDEQGALEPLDGYFTEEELAAYVPGFLEEGRFSAESDLRIFPILKSTEIFSANRTDWEPFAQATGITLESIETKEDLTRAAEAYYLWTDALTPDVPEDGKALYGRDSIANYLYIGSYQLGHELFRVENGELTVDLDRETFRTMWDQYYIPYINGYFGSFAQFRSEDCKTGKILALTSSSSSVSYLPTAVTMADDTTHDIETYIRRALPFAGAETEAEVQQGAGYCLLKSTPAQMEGAVEFLKWFTQPDRNLEFALMSGYMPVTVEAITKETLTGAFGGDSTTAKGQNMLSSLLVCADAFSVGTPYATKPFQGSKDARAILDTSLEELAIADRAAVVSAIAGGASRADAVAPYSTDAYFDAWFDGIAEEINRAIYGE